MRSGSIPTERAVFLIVAAVFTIPVASVRAHIQRVSQSKELRLCFSVTSPAGQLATNVRQPVGNLKRRGMPAHGIEAASSAKPRFGNPRIVRNVLSNWGSYVVTVGLNFFLSPYVVRHLGNTGYGVWILTLSLTGYLGLLDLGVRGAVTRYIAKFHTEGDQRKASNVASSAMMIFSSAGLLAVLVSALMAGIVIGRMNIPPQFLMAARAVLLLT